MKLADSEVFLLDAFDRLFTFELAVRHTRRNTPENARQREAYTRLLQLRSEIAHGYAASALPQAAAEANVDLDTERFVSLVFDYLQFGADPVAALGIVDAEPERLEPLERELRRLCEEITGSEMAAIETAAYYRLDDLTAPNDILDLIHWWKHILGGRTEKEAHHAHLEGKFGHIGRKGNTIEAYSFDFRYPPPLRKRPTNYGISVGQGQRVNGQDVGNAVVLWVSTDAPAANLDAILREFRAQFGLAQASYVVEQMQQGVIPSFWAPPSPPLGDALREKRKRLGNTYIKRYDSIEGLLVGLHCWDRYDQGGISLPEAAEATLNELPAGSAFEVETVMGRCDEIRRMLNGVCAHLSRWAHAQGD